MTSEIHASVKNQDKVIVGPIPNQDKVIVGPIPTGNGTGSLHSILELWHDLAFVLEHVGAFHKCRWL
jgi:hypothetical protein